MTANSGGIQKWMKLIILLWLILLGIGLTVFGAVRFPDRSELHIVHRLYRDDYIWTSVSTGIDCGSITYFPDLPDVFGYAATTQWWNYSSLHFANYADIKSGIAEMEKICPTK